MIKYKKIKEGGNMTIKEALEKGTVMLKGENLDSPKLKARLLMQDVLAKPRQYLLVHDNEEINEEILKKYFNNVLKVKQGTPIEHITHVKEFMKMNFFVDENVLIPRQDTEILVEEVIKIANKNNSIKILDLCTGSGAIAVSLAKYIENSEITAVDISEKALGIAKRNAKINKVENKITFVKSDLFNNLANNKFDIIVSNPPYIKKQTIKTLEKQVQKEPLIALDGGEDGLDFYKKIIKNAYIFLKYNGYLCFEIGYDQKQEVIDLIVKEEKYINTYSKKDLYDNDRIVITKVG
jgi:release factor glutamine methyltransferase